MSLKVIENCLNMIFFYNVHHGKFYYPSEHAIILSHFSSKILFESNKLVISQLWDTIEIKTQDSYKNNKYSFCIQYPKLFPKPQPVILD